MRLLLDEHLIPQIAEQLRAAGHDVAAVVETDLRGLADSDLLARATVQRRALVTENVRHFAPLVGDWAAQDRDHFGVVFCSATTIRRTRQSIGGFVRSLAELLDANPAEDAIRNSVRWLRS